MRPAGVVTVSAATDIIVDVEPGDIVTVYVDGGAEVAWERDNGPKVIFYRAVLATNQMCTGRITVPLGVNRLTVRGDGSPSSAVFAAVASEFNPCG